jgi:glycosyltransferase involved in cell wall biosynthesis
MRVVLACNFARDEKLGTARTPLRLAEHLGKVDVDVSLFFANDLPPGPRGRGDLLTAPFRMAALLARRARGADVVDVAGFDAWAYARFARRWRAGQATVSRSNGLWDQALATAEPPRGAQAGGRTGARVLLSDLYQRHVLRRWERASMVEADLALFLSRSDADEIVRRGWKAAAGVAAVNPGVDEFFGSPAPLAERRDVAFVGTFFYRKGSDVVARAMSNALRARPALGLTIFGAGLPEHDVRAAFDADVRARVTVVGPMPAAELARRLSTFAIFFFPTRYEGFGIVTIEAMRAGLAVVTTPTGAGVDVVRDGENGLVVPVGSSEAAEAAVLRLVDDPALRARLGARAIADTEDRTWARAAREVRSVYERARERAAARGRGSA